MKFAWTFPWLIALQMWSIQTLAADVSIYQASEPGRSVVEIEYNGTVTSFLVWDKDLEDPKTVDRITNIVLTGKPLEKAEKK